jgi:hypothetical protein
MNNRTERFMTVFSSASFLNDARAMRMILGLCALPASSIAGLLWVNFRKFAQFYFSLGLTILATVLILFVKEKS